MKAKNAVQQQVHNILYQQHLAMIIKCAGQRGRDRSTILKRNQSTKSFLTCQARTSFKNPRRSERLMLLVSKICSCKTMTKSYLRTTKDQTGMHGDTSWQCIPCTNSHQRISEGQQTIQKSLQIYIFLHVVPCLPEKVQRSQKKNAGNLNTTKTRGEGMTETITKCIVLIGSWNEASISPNYTEGLQRQPKLAHCEQMEFSDGFFSYAISN